MWAHTEPETESMSKHFTWTCRNYFSGDTIVIYNISIHLL